MNFSFIKDSRGHAHASLKLFYEFMIKIAAFRCWEHDREVLAEVVTLESVGLRVDDEELRRKFSNHRWGWTLERILAQCQVCFNLPEAELRNAGSYTRRQKYLASRPWENRAKWAVHLSTCSDSLFRKLQESPGERFADVAQRRRDNGGELFNVNFQYSAVQERTFASTHYLKSFEGKVKGKTKEELGREFGSAFGIGHFAAGHALLLLSEGGSVEKLGTLGVKNSRVVFAGSGTYFEVRLILSHKIGWMLRSLSEYDVERVIVESRGGLASAADRLFEKGVIQAIPYCVRRDKNGHFVAIDETVADLFCESRQCINFMMGVGNIRNSVKQPNLQRKRKRGKYSDDV